MGRIGPDMVDGEVEDRDEVVGDVRLEVTFFGGRR